LIETGLCALHTHQLRFGTVTYVSTRTRFVRRDIEQALRQEGLLDGRE
jgi:hypothetical protein